MKVMAFLLIVSQCRYKGTFIILKRKSTKMKKNSILTGELAKKTIVP
jgi:hypothetical protein